MDLLSGSQKVNLADLLEIHANGVTREHDSRGILTTASLQARTLLGALRGRGNSGNLLHGHGVGIIVVGKGGNLARGIPVIGIVIVGVVATGPVFRGHDVYALVTESTVEILELIVVNINLAQGNLDVVLADASHGLGRLDQLAKRALELRGQLRIVLCSILACHVVPLDVAPMHRCCYSTRFSHNI